MTKSQHKRTAVASMFQNGISRNTKCAIKDGFCRDSHISYWSHVYNFTHTFLMDHIGVTHPYYITYTWFYYIAPSFCDSTCIFVIFINYTEVTKTFVNKISLQHPQVQDSTNWSKQRYKKFSPYCMEIWSYMVQHPLSSTFNMLSYFFYP